MNTPFVHQCEAGGHPCPCLPTYLDENEFPRQRYVSVFPNRAERRRSKRRLAKRPVTKSPLRGHPRG